MQGDQDPGDWLLHHPMEDDDAPPGRWPRRTWAYLALGAACTPAAFFLHEGLLENALPASFLAIPAILLTALVAVASVVWLTNRRPLPATHPFRAGTLTATTGAMVGFIVFGGAYGAIATLNVPTHCGYTPTHAQWTEPGLFDDFPGPIDDGDVNISQFVPKGLPFEDPALETIARGAALTEIQFWLPDAEGRFHGPTSIALDGSLQLRFQADDRWTQQELEHRYQQFMANVSLTNTTQRSDWSDALFSNGRPADIITQTLDENDEWVDVTYTMYTTNITGPFRLEEFGSQFRHRDTMEWKYGTQWVYEFQLPEKSLHLTEKDIELIVDSIDHVQVEAVYGEMNDTAYLDLLETALGPHLPLPHLHEAEVQGVVC